MADRPTLRPLGDSALQLVWDDCDWMEAFPRVQAYARQFEQSSLPGILATVPAYQTLTVHYDPRVWLWGEIAEELSGWTVPTPLSTEDHSPLVEIPVCYNEEYGLDLHEIAARSHRTVDEVIHLLASKDYFVQMIGFAPGFPYMAGLPDELNTPRKGTPRLEVPAGSVAIGGAQLGIYSMTSPGGWNILGRTPLELFRPDREPACLLKAGDRVRFVAITRDQFRKWEQA